jgi:hypothetical protein
LWIEFPVSLDVAFWTHRRMKAIENTITAVNFRVLVFFLLGPPLVFGQRMDSFEGGAPRWGLVESDCDARLVEHEISLIMPRSGRACEMFELSCSPGSAALMAYPIEPCAVLNEFQPALWVRCASGQIRLGVRVVFPNAVHPISQSRFTVILWGDLYSQPGSWQRLQVHRLAEQLQQEIIAIRKRFDQSLDLEHAYVDSVILNAYTGPGRYRVQVDDLDLSGMIPLASFGIPLNPNWRQRWRWRDVVESNFGATQAFPVWVQHRGEQPAWLASLGFSGLLLQELPSSAQLKQIHEAGVQVISPPPHHHVEFEAEHLNRVKGWMIGAALNRDQTDLAKRKIEQTERLPSSLRRPTFGEPLEHFWQYSRLVNQTIVPSPDPVSAGELIGKRNWLTSTINEVRLRSDGWVSIQASVNPAIESQVKTATERIESLPAERMESSANLADPVGLRREVIAAVMSGAKGVVYRTQEPLTDPITYQGLEDRALQAAMRWCNQEIRLWTPWITAGQVISPPQLDRADFSAVRWRLKDSELILIQNTSPESQWCMPGTRGAPVRISISDGNAQWQTIRLTEGRMETMTVQGSRGNQQWQVENPNSAEIFVLTHNPQVLGYLRRAMEQAATNNAADQLDIASYCLQQASELFSVRFQGSGVGSEVDNEAIVSGQKRILSAIEHRLQLGWQALQSRQPTTATRHAMVAIDQAQQLTHEALLVATRDLASPQSSPFVLMPATLKYHWMIAEACSRAQWEMISIPGSQFTDLSQMLSAGWSQQRRSEDRFDWRVELVPQQPGGSPGLRMAAYAKQERRMVAASSTASGENASGNSIPGGYEGASLRVRSAGLPVRRGQFIRVTAKASIRYCDANSTAGLLVYDNQAGPSLGQLIRGRSGERIDIEMYRFVVDDGEFRLLAECRGECDIQMSDLIVAVIEPATDRRSFETNPLVSDPISSYPQEIP